MNEEKAEYFLKNTNLPIMGSFPVRRRKNKDWDFLRNKNKAQ